MTIIPLLLFGGGVALLAALSKKKQAASGGASWDEVYRYAMSADVRDLDYLAGVAAQLRAVGWAQQAGNIEAKISSIRAQQAADAAAASQARADWERQNGGRPSQANLDALWTSVQNPNLSLAELQFAAAMFQVYGTPDRLLYVQSRIAALQTPASPPPSTGTGGTAPGETPAQPPAETPRMGIPEQPGTGTGAEPTPAPIGDAETSPDVDPDGTIALARDLINVESTSGWRETLKPEIEEWQRAKQLKVDGKFGPKSALLMAQDVAILPLIRYWPKGSVLSTALRQYRDALYTMAANLDERGESEHAIGLRSSAEHEKGQGYPKVAAPVPVQQRQQQATSVSQLMARLIAGEQSRLAAPISARPGESTAPSDSEAVARFNATDPGLGE